MRGAFVTTEFTGLPCSGGIGSYYHHASVSLANEGVEVEVFTSGNQGDISPLPGVVFHHLGASSMPEFGLMAAHAVKIQHELRPFDLVECADLKAEGHLAALAIRSAAFVIRVHSPSVILDRYLDLSPNLYQRLESVFWQITGLIGAWRRGLPLQPLRLEPFSFAWNPSRDVEERNAAADADLLLVMNSEMRKFAIHHWWIKLEAIAEVPNPIVMDFQEPSGINPNDTPTLGFLGRLEPRKGIVVLAKVLLKVLPDFPEWRVEIAGEGSPSCISGANAGEVARKMLKPLGERVKFIGPIAPDLVPAWLSKMELCVFPSLWETFSYVALEAAYCGRAIVATDTGAIPLILDSGRVGEIVPPGNVRCLARALRKIMADSVKRSELGKKAADHVRNHFNRDKVTRQILHAYKIALTRRDQRLATTKKNIKS